MHMALHPDFLRLPIAHRALHDLDQGRSENSRAAAAAAMAAGYAIEIDVQMSRDGTAMVFHDDDLPRLTGQAGLVRDFTAAQLGQMLLLRGGGDTIPTLAQILAQVAGRVPLLIEIKDQTGSMGVCDGQLEAAVARDLHGYAGPVAVMSFNPHSVAHMARLAPAVARGLTTSAYNPDDWAPLPAELCDRLRGIPDYAATLSSFISHEAADLNRPRVAALRAQGAAILCWTIKSQKAEAVARKVAQNITFERYLAKHPQ